MSISSDRQSSDVVSGDSMPSKRWNFQRLQQASGLRRIRGLQFAAGPVTNVVTYLLMCIPPEETAVIVLVTPKWPAKG